MNRNRELKVGVVNERLEISRYYYKEMGGEFGNGSGSGSGRGGHKRQS